jgi:hypothetical protein
MASEWQEHSCGGCGEAKHRIKALPRRDGSRGFRDVALICTGCGSVTHLLPQSAILEEWGREKEGEKNDGIIAPMEWPRNPDGSPK